MVEMMSASAANFSATSAGSLSRKTANLIGMTDSHLGALSCSRLPAACLAFRDGPEKVVHVAEEADEVIIVDSRCFHADDERSFLRWGHLFDGLGESHDGILAGMMILGNSNLDHGEALARNSAAKTAISFFSISKRSFTGRRSCRW